MKGPWAVLLSTAVLMGCRGSQPATNPFLRTTVPPPATGQAAVVTPGEPYYPPSTPQTLPPANVAPGIAPAPVPYTPPVVAPQAAPPLVIPPKDKYSPPGGSFLYNQS